MRGNLFGKLFSFCSFGESHGPAVGVVIDGVPPGLKFQEDELCAQLAKRAPGSAPWMSSRKEPDVPQILSGIYEGKTLGTPIAVVVFNQNAQSQDYDWSEKEHRPGHADKTQLQKYGIRDPRGGGRASGRETLARVIAGYFASLILPDIRINTVINKIGQHPCDSVLLNEEAKNYLMGLKANGESAGARLTCEVLNVAAGLGEPVFEKLKADLARALMSIGGCVGILWGKELLSEVSGTEYSRKELSGENLLGGLEGGMSNGKPLSFQIFFKAPSTTGSKAKEGRHDPCLVPRVIPVVEAMVRVVLADHHLRQRAYTI